MLDLGEDLERLAKTIVDAGYQVHRVLGPGLLERVYESAMALEMAARGLKVQRQVQVPIHYLGQELEDPLKLDLLVEASIILEIKAVAALLPVHKAQLMTYLKLSGRRLGFLLNFNVGTYSDGIQRVIL